MPPLFAQTDALITEGNEKAGPLTNPILRFAVKKAEEFGLTKALGGPIGKAVDVITSGGPAGIFTQQAGQGEEAAIAAMEEREAQIRAARLAVGTGVRQRMETTDP